MLPGRYYYLIIVTIADVVVYFILTQTPCTHQASGKSQVP